MEEVICFKHDKMLNEANLPKGVEKSFEVGNETFYIVKQINLLSANVLNDDDADMSAEYKRIEKQMEKITQSLLLEGVTQISLTAYKQAETESKKTKSNNFLDNLTEDERFIYEKTRAFLTEYDIRVPAQKHFITSLRSKITQGENINEETLSRYADKMNKNIDDLFDFATQGIICDFIAVAQEQLAQSKQQTKKKKIIK